MKIDLIFCIVQHKKCIYICVCVSACMLVYTIEKRQFRDL